MEGYERTPIQTHLLCVAIIDALYANPTQRLGQLLINLVRDNDGSRPDDVLLWNTHDEEWAELLRKAVQ